MRLEDLAQETETDAASLERLLRVLHGEDLVVLNSEEQFELTEEGRYLCTDQLGDLARYVGAPIGWDPWALLPEAVRTGTAAFQSRYGSPLFDFLDDDQHANDASLYHAAIDSFSRAESRALAEAFDFADAQRVADIGGGRGALLVDVLTRWPHLHGVLLERPAAVAEAKVLFETSGIASRCQTQTADFFEQLPDHVDTIVLKHIIHSWDDEASVKLLRRCAEAVGPNGRVLVIEGVLLPAGRPNLTSLLDLEMLVLCGPGHERTKPEMRRLLSRSGLRLEHNVELTESAYLFVTRPRSEL